MGLFGIFGSNRRSRDAEELQREYERVLMEKERAESIMILDKLEKNFWAMGEYYKSSEYDVLSFVAKQSVKSEFSIQTE